MKIAKVTDRMLEAAVVPSFTRIGPLVRRRLFDWTPLDSYDLSGTFVAITGATSGLGLAAAQQFVTMGADVVMISRNETKALEVAATIGTGPGRIHHLTADMGDLDQVRAAVGGLREITDRLDVLIHNAGALINPRRTTDDGSELTVRVQVVSPYLLTGLLLDPLRRASPGRVLTMSSGGMYTSGLTVDRLEMP
ncbi:MAG: SDR family NAD(P)-dependent oxidoreductase, partial [Acidimicrobiia bacterium]|nr:SDR family NAD(P)-dependent oxidoreductase [Acidimicrobiia bacterium]